MASIPRELSPADSALGQPPAGKLLSEEQFVAWCDEDTRAEWAAIPPRDGKVASIVVPGFYLRAEGLWSQPLPAVPGLLSELLSESPPTGTREEAN